MNTAETITAIIVAGCVALAWIEAWRNKGSSEANGKRDE